MSSTPAKKEQVTDIEIPMTRIASEKTRWFEKLNERLSDWCSPLLVKETRQALKSRQFLYTYFLLLLAVALWVIIGIGWNQWTGNGPSEPSGRDLLYGMFVLLAIPLGIVIPFSAYRSLAKEFEDGTIQLISITTMKPYQILVGKLGSAILQMLVYLSVMAPCILLGYMLRGVSLPQLFFTLIIGIFASLCLTVLGLFLGGVTKGRGFNTAVSVGFILLLALLNYGWFWAVEEFLQAPNFDDLEFRVVFLMFLIHPFAFALLLLIASAAQISFRADNQSTSLRIAMMIQQALFIGSMVTITAQESFPKEAVGICSIVASHYWLIMGFMLVGEVPQMSRRIKRTLPTSWFGRTFKSLLMPGPGRGLLFALAMLWSCGFSFALLAHFAAEVRELLGPMFAANSFTRATTWNNAFELYYIAFVTCFYPTLFLAIGYLIAHWRLHRKISREGGVGPVLMLFAGCLMVAFSIIFAALAHSRFGVRPMMSDNSLASFCNWYWMFGESIGTGRLANEPWFFQFALPMSVIIAIAILIASRELLLTPMAVPERVKEDSKPIEPQLPPGESIEEIFGKAGN